MSEEKEVKTGGVAPRLDLHELPKKPGRRKKGRVGRGTGSGSGKTSGKGQKGQKARSGGAPPPRFEGGQTPLHRRVPKRKGFTPRPKTPQLEVNLYRLDASGLTDVTIDSLRDAGIVKTKRSVKYYNLKVLGFGEITRALTIKCHAISEGARAKVEAAGGKVEILEVVYKNRPVAEDKSA